MDSIRLDNWHYKRNSMNKCLNKNAGNGFHLPYIQLVWISVAFLYSSFAFAEEEYRLGGGDAVNIAVYEQPDLSVEARISQEDGSISYPLLGRVVIGGLTAEAAGQKIAKLLKDRGFLKVPQVALTVKEFISQKIPVMGQVSKPGEYALRGESRVIDLIAQAGGVNENANDIIAVIKNENGEQVRYQVDLLRFYAGDMSQNIKVTEGDFILVPRMDAFYIHGEIRSPGSYRLMRNMTVMQALSVGGGLSGRGSQNGIKVTRRLADDQTEQIAVQLTDLLQPNDVVYVKERLF